MQPRAAPGAEAYPMPLSLPLAVAALLALPLLALAPPAGAQASLPDLTLRHDGAPQAQAREGDTVTLWYVVNLKPAANRTFDVEVRVDGALVGAQRVTLAPDPSCGKQPDGSVVVCDSFDGLDRRVGFTWAAAPGSRRVVATVDPANQVAERDEANNTLAHTIEVAPARTPQPAPPQPGPDYGSGLHIQTLDATVRPYELREGEPASLLLASDFAAARAPRNAWVRFEVDGKTAAEVPAGVERLGPADQGKEQFRMAAKAAWDTAGKAGYHRLVARLVFEKDTSTAYTYEGATPVPFNVQPRQAQAQQPAQAPAQPEPGRVAQVPAAPETPAASPQAEAAPPYVVAGSVALSVAQPEPGQAVRVYARVHNPSGQEALVRGQLLVAQAGQAEQGQGLAEARVPAGASVVLEFPWTVPAGGDYQLKVALGEGSALPVAPEGASAAKLAVGQAARGKPALVLSAGLVNIGTIEHGTERTVPLEVTAYNAPAHGVRIDVLDAGGVRIEPVSPPVDILPGQTVRYYVKVTVGALEGNASLGAKRILLQAYAAGEGSGGSQGPAMASNVEQVDFVLHQAGFAGVPGFGGLAAIGAAAAGGAASFFRRRLGGG